MLKRAVAFALSKKQLKIRHQHSDRLVGQFFARLNVLVPIGAMVCHIIPLHRELVAWRRHFARGEELRDVKHLFKLMCKLIVVFSVVAVRR